MVVRVWVDSLPLRCAPAGNDTLSGAAERSPGSPEEMALELSSLLIPGVLEMSLPLAQAATH